MKCKNTCTQNTVNSRLANTRYYGQNPALPSAKARGLTKNYSRYCRLLLLRTPNYVPRVSAITRVDSYNYKART